MKIRAQPVFSFLLLGVFLCVLYAFVVHSAAAEPPFYPDKTRLLVYRDANDKEHPITTAADWAKRREHILANMQLVMGPLPDDSRKVPLDPKVEGESDQGRFTRYKMTIAVEKDDPLPLCLLVPEKSARKQSATTCRHPPARAPDP